MEEKKDEKKSVAVVDSDTDEKMRWRLLEAFLQTNSLVSNQIESFNDFVTFGMQEIVNQEPIITAPNGYVVKFGHISLSVPQVIEEDRTLHNAYPNDARRRDLSYDSAIHLDVTEIDLKGVQKYHPKVIIGRLPVMLRSCVCNLSKMSEQQRIDNGECRNDHGGYFIVKGNERVIVGQMRGAYNTVIVQEHKPGDPKYKYSAETRSMSNETGHSVLIQVVISNDDRTINFIMPFVQEAIPVGVVFKALGFTSDRDIMALLGLGVYPQASKYVQYVLRDSFFCANADEAQEYIGRFAAHMIKKDREKSYAQQVTENELLPHIGIAGSKQEKACFLGHMVRKLVMTRLKLRSEDDRDNYANKRVEVAGQLLYDLFRHLYKLFIIKPVKEMLMETKPNKHQKLDLMQYLTKITGITKIVQRNIATGKWGIQKNATYMRTGVSQLLERMTYCATLSHLRRIIIPIGKEGKNAAIRQIHQSSIFYICPCETPEGAKVGIVLNLALTSKITKRTSSVMVRKVLDECKTVIPVNSIMEKAQAQASSDSIAVNIGTMTTIFLNGVVVGFTADAQASVTELHYCRTRGLLDREVSVAYDSVDNDIRVFADEGRFIRPLMTVENGRMKLETLLQKNQIDWKSPRLWKTLMKLDAVRFIDAAEACESVIAMTAQALKKQAGSEYCEIHPACMLGVMAAMIPFPDHSQSPRNCYQCLSVDEQVVMADGTLRKIADIKIGDSVITVNPATCVRTATHVVNQYVRDTEKEIVKVVTVSGRQLVCTYDHPILVEQRDRADNRLWNRAWVRAADLLPDDRVCVCLPPAQEQFLSSSEHEYIRYLNHTRINTRGSMIALRRLRQILRHIGDATTLPVPVPVSFTEWQASVYTYNDSVFVPVQTVYRNQPSVKIADITTESECHSFITGHGICVHNSSMGKQALGIPTLSYAHRTDTIWHVLSLPQKPIVTTVPAGMIGINDMPSGINAIVAIACYTGFNQEDSAILNLSSVQRGLFQITSYHTLDCAERKHISTITEKICMPPPNSDPLSVKPGSINYFRRKNANYDLLGPDGIISLKKADGTSMSVVKGDVLVGKIVTTSSKTGAETRTDASLVVQQGEEGVIDRIHITVTPNGFKLVKVVIGVLRSPTIGDKIASRAAQKATIGMLYRSEDMPFSQTTGLMPDIIINPCCIPSRMTVNQLIETALGKACCITGGGQGDATPFTERSKNVASKMLEAASSELLKHGMNPCGWETLTNGMTGEEIKAKIFIGPTYYQRLKHMVDDKMHARARGQVTMLTRQPLEGRSKDGGLRVGEGPCGMPQWYLIVLLVYVR